MQDFVSAQTYALRNYGATTQPGGVDHWGFAWSPKNASGLPATDFDTQSGQIIDRLASAIHDSDHSPDPSDPGRNACGVGQDWCATSLSGAAFSDAWKSFAYWGQLSLAFTTPAQAIVAGSASQPLAVQLQASGAAQASPGDVVVTLGSSSSAGSFSTGDGVWSPTLQLTVANGATTTPAFLYRDTNAGTPAITAAASGITSATQTVTVNAGALASIKLTPASATVNAGATQAFSAAGADAYGNPVPIAGATWSVAPASLGTLSASTGTSTVFTAAASAGSGSVSATVGSASGSAAVTVATQPVVPGVPTQVTAAPAASRGISLTWRASASQGSSPVTGYRVYRGSRSGAETLLTTVGNVLAYTDASARSGSIFFYRLVAVSAAGQSAMSAEVSARAR